MIVNLVMEKLILGPQSEEFLSKELTRLQPEVEAQIKSYENEILKLQREGEIAYANITFQLDSSGKKGQASSLARVALKKVEVTDRYKQGRDWARKGISIAALGAHAAGMTSELMTYSEAVSLHADLVAEGADRLENRLQEIERELEPLVISLERIDELNEERDLVLSCLETLLSDEGVPHFGMLAGLCADLIPHKRPRK